MRPGSLVVVQVLLIFTTRFATSDQNVIPPEIQAELDTFIESWMTELNIVGVGLAITRGDGELAYTRGYGYRDVENRLQVDPTTFFSIGSITKV